MNALGRRIAEIIRRDGPITLERYWNLALYDREHGYYSRQTPFGREGDFTTAPEISQMFGELIGAWLVAAWRALDRPAPFVLAEMGPGRGTLMADILRTIRSLDPDFLKAAKIRLVETSDRLAGIQMQTLERFDLPVGRVRSLREIEALPLFLVANELFDAIAIRQLVRDGGVWRERLVDVIEDERFAFVAGKAVQDVRVTGQAVDGAILEVSPARDVLAGEISRRITAGGAALLIDYGHEKSAPGDTLQAVRGHAFADPLAAPGEVDITSHVDFQRLAGLIGAAGASVAPVTTQGDFLLSLGLLERAGALGADKTEKEREAIRQAVARLAGHGENEMGRLFKVLAAASSPLPLPPFMAPTNAAHKAGP